VSESTGNKALVVGLDGACFDLLAPWIDEGHLPVLDSMMKSGAHGVLESALPPITPVCWTTFMTGKNPGKHGVFEFLMRTRAGDEVPVDSSRRHGSAIWDVLARAGRRSIVLNVPVTYPPAKLEGLMVSGFLTPRGKRDFTYPAGLLQEIEDRFGPYRLYLNEAYAPGNVDAILRELEESLDYKCRVARYLMEKHPWDLCVIHILGTDRIQHELMHIIDPAHPNRRAGEAAYRRRILDYFKRVDGEVGALMETAGPETTTFVMSDHGSGPIYKFMHFNVWLLGQGYVALKPRALTRLKRALFEIGVTPETAYKAASRFKMGGGRVAVDLERRSCMIRALNRFFLSADDIDWSRTTAYSKGNYGQIFVNLKGREPRGVVEPGAQFEAVRSEIIRKLKGKKLSGPSTPASSFTTGPSPPVRRTSFSSPRT